MLLLNSILAAKKREKMVNGEFWCRMQENLFKKAVDSCVKKRVGSRGCQSKAIFPYFLRFAK